MSSRPISSNLLVSPVQNRKCFNIFDIFTESLSILYIESYDTDESRGQKYFRASSACVGKKKCFISSQMGNEWSKYHTNFCSEHKKSTAKSQNAKLK